MKTYSAKATYVLIRTALALFLVAAGLQGIASDSTSQLGSLLGCLQLCFGLSILMANLALPCELTARSLARPQTFDLDFAMARLDDVAPLSPGMFLGAKRNRWGGPLTSNYRT